MANPLKDLGQIPVDEENEALIISNVIKNSNHRDSFVKKIDYRLFRTEQFQNLAWAVKAIVDAKMDMNTDALLLKSKVAPIRKAIDFQFIETVIQNFPEVSTINFEEHLHKLHFDSIKAQVLDRIFNSLYVSLLDPTKSLSSIEERVRALNSIIETGYASTRCEFKDMNEVVSDFIESKTKIGHKRTTGFRQLDELLTEGFMDGQICVIAGLAGMGKSSMALSIMKNLSNKGEYTAQFALEMPNKSLTAKLLAFNSRVAVKRIAGEWDHLNDEEKKIIAYELELLRKNQYIYLNDRPTQSLSEIKEQIILLQDRLQTQYIAIVIDLFGKIRDLLRSDNFARSYEQQLNTTQVFTRELGVHTTLVAQINREVAKRKFARPKMSDLKNAGAFEEVADLIFGIHRPYYNPDVALKRELAYGTSEEIEEDPNQNLAELILLKQRMGVGNKIINFFFNPLTTRLSPIDAEYQNIVNMSKSDLFSGGDDD